MVKLLSEKDYGKIIIKRDGELVYNRVVKYIVNDKHLYIFYYNDQIMKDPIIWDIEVYEIETD